MTPLDTMPLEAPPRWSARGAGLLSHVVPCMLIALTLVGPLQAQSCSGGTDGGMDATGSLCNSPAAGFSTPRTATTAKVARGSDGSPREASEPSFEKRSLAARSDLAAERNAKSSDSLRRGGELKQVPPAARARSSGTRR